MLHVPVLPLELIVEILSWVPVKSLMRFRCVSKAWNCLIFDPALVKLQLQRCSKNSHILLRFLTAPSGDERGICLGATPCSIHCFLENTSSTIDDSIHLFNRANSVFGSCNGLVCLCESSVGVEFGEYKVRFWNPTTRTMSQYSPRLLLHSTNYQTEHYSLRYGFGFDGWSHTYKVIVVIMDIKSHTKEVRVHCMGETCWRKTLTFPSIPFLSKVDGQYMSGTVNWLALRRTVTTNQLVIFSYDLKKGTYRYLLMPKDDIEVSFIEPYLGVMKGCLCLSHDHKRTHFVVWLMREYGVEKSWTQLFKLSYEHLHNHGLPPCRVMPLCMSHDEDVVMLADYGGFKFVLYNRRASRIDRTEGFNYNTFSFTSFDYVQSLVLPYQNSATLH